MKIYNVKQGSAEWLALRLGIPTASEFDSIITPKTGALSAAWKKYAYRLIAERLLNRPVQSIDGIEYVERGKELEPVAVRQFEFQTDLETAPVGFITTDDGLMGASPDRLILGKQEGVEIKCPAAHTHIGYLLAGHEDKYRPQVQGQILIGEMDKAFFYSFHPLMPPALIETGRDEPYIKLMESALGQFQDNLHEMLERARSLGIYQAYPSILTAHEAEHEMELADDR